jgi:hypothetical protein
MKSTEKHEEREREREREREKEKEKEKEREKRERKCECYFVFTEQREMKKDFNWFCISRHHNESCNSSIECFSG